jgi:hypothetical protein
MSRWLLGPVDGTGGERISSGLNGVFRAALLLRPHAMK